jgi:phage-related minor tail protein
LANNDIGYYTLPVILSMEGIEKQVDGRLSKVFGDVGKKAGKSLADGAEQDVKRLTDAYGKLRDRASDALGKVRVEEEKLAKARAGGKADMIVAAEERLNKARRDSQRINREAAASYDLIADAQKRLGDSSSGLLSKMKGAAGAARSSGGEAATGFVDGFGGPIAALGTKAGPIGVALAAASAVGLLAGKVIGDQVMAGIGQQQDQANVAAKLGLTAAQVKPLASAAAEAYVGNFGASINANMDAARAAIQGGLIGPNASQADIQKVVEQLSTVAAVTGEDIPSAVRTAQQAVRTGLVGSYTEALDLIVKSQQNGLNASGDLLDTINEYGTQFRKLGLTGPEAMGLISQAVKGGARDTDVAADALKEFSIRAIDGSKTTGDAYHLLGLSFKGTTEAFAAGGDTAKQMFQEVVSRISAIEDPAQRAAVQVALFGTQAEDLGNALNNMNLGTAVSEFGQVAGAAEQASDTLGGTAASAIESAKRSIEVSVQGIQQSLAGVFGPALQNLADWVTSHRGEIFDFFTGMGHVAIDAGTFVVRSMGDVISIFGQLGQVLGDIQGGMLKFQAFQADIRGDDETAKELRAQAEEAFGYGEGLAKMGDAMKAVDPAKMHAALDDAAAKAKTATTETTAFGVKVDELGKKDIAVPVAVKGIDTASRDLDTFFEKYSKMQITPELMFGGANGAMSAAGITPTTPGSLAYDGEHPQITAIKATAERFGMTNFVGKDSHQNDGLNHPKGMAGDFSGGADLSPEMLRFATYMSQNFGQYISELIYGDPSFKGLIGGPYDQKTLSEHLNHVHIAVKDDMAQQFQAAIAKSGLNLAASGAGLTVPAAPATGSPAAGGIQSWLAEQLKANGLSPDQIKGILAMNAVEGGAADPKSILGFVEGQDLSKRLGPGRKAIGPEGHLAGFMAQWNDMPTVDGSPQTPKRRGPNGEIPGVDASGKVTDWTAYMTWIREKIVGQLGVSSDWQGEAQPAAAEYQRRLMEALNSGGQFTPWNAAAPAPAVAAPTLPVSVTQAAPAAAAAASPLDMSNVYPTSGTYGPGGSPDLVNAFGPGYKPGIGTPGYDAYGTPGYYQADAKAVRNAQRRAQDANDAIAEADAAAQAARDAKTALDDTPFVTPAAIAGANEAVRKAEKRAADARESAAEAAADAADTAKGNFTKAQEAEKAKKPEKAKRGSKGDSGLGGLGSIGASFLKDTFGIGDWLPGLDNLMPLQMADGLMSGLFMPMLQGGMEGGLNFQNPDWQPGMTKEDLAAANQASGFVPGATSGAPFGIPDIGAPPMPQSGAYGGGGAPAPTIVNVDQSQNFTNSPIGHSPDEIEKNRQRNINRAPRLPVGIG